MKKPTLKFQFIKEEELGSSSGLRRSKYDAGVELAREFPGKLVVLRRGTSSQLGGSVPVFRRRYKKTGVDFHLRRTVQGDYVIIAVKRGPGRPKKG